MACIGVSGIALGFFAGWFLHAPSNIGPTSLRQSDIASSTSYQFIDPLLAIRISDQGNSREYNDLFNTVTALITSAQKDKKIEKASVFFRDMGQSKGFIINSGEQYNPASLFKVPTMMSYLKIAESNPSILSSSATYSGTHDANVQENFPSAQKLSSGTYTISTLLEHMIKHSDNNASETLINYLNDTGNVKQFGKLFYDLGISQIDLNSDFMTVRAYGLFFRVLYNATYLNRDNSEAALKLLAQTDFVDALRAGVPSSITVAHKFGEFTLQTQSGAIIKRELHDCGIVYYPKHPYLLCVMTKGMDFNSLISTISGISQEAYSFMAAKYPPTY